MAGSSVAEPCPTPRNRRWCSGCTRAVNPRHDCRCSRRKQCDGVPRLGRVRHSEPDRSSDGGLPNLDTAEDHRLTAGAALDGLVSRMTEAAHPRQLWPTDFTEEAMVWQATGILMSRFDLDAERALELVRKISKSTSGRMCVIAEQIINHEVRVEIMRNLEHDVHGFY